MKKVHDVRILSVIADILVWLMPFTSDVLF